MQRIQTARVCVCVCLCVSLLMCVCVCVRMCVQQHCTYKLGIMCLHPDTRPCIVSACLAVNVPLSPMRPQSLYVLCCSALTGPFYKALIYSSVADGYVGRTSRVPWRLGTITTTGDVYDAVTMDRYWSGNCIVGNLTHNGVAERRAKWYGGQFIVYTYALLKAMMHSKISILEL